MKSRIVVAILMLTLSAGAVKAADPLSPADATAVLVALAPEVAPALLLLLPQPASTSVAASTGSAVGISAPRIRNRRSVVPPFM